MHTSQTITPLTFTATAGLSDGCVSPNGNPEYAVSRALIGGASGAAALITGGLIGHGMDQQAEAQRASQPPPTAVVVTQGQPLSMADVKAMAKTRVGDDIIINQIINKHSVYNLDANTIIDLKNAGVSDKVITYMMNTAANVVTSQAPSPPPTPMLAASAGSHYVWVDGDWTWNGVAWVWMGGRWTLPPCPHAIWVGPCWEHGPYGRHRVSRHWR